jgi:hypothetical protein
MKGPGWVITAPFCDEEEPSHLQFMRRETVLEVSENHAELLSRGRQAGRGVARGQFPAPLGRCQEVNSPCLIHA